jgi:hypothetical protein
VNFGPRPETDPKITFFFFLFFFPSVRRRATEQLLGELARCAPTPPNAPPCSLWWWDDPQAQAVTTVPGSGVGGNGANGGAAAATAPGTATATTAAAMETAARNRAAAAVGPGGSVLRCAADVPAGRTARSAQAVAAGIALGMVCVARGAYSNCAEQVAALLGWGTAVNDGFCFYANGGGGGGPGAASSASGGADGGGGGGSGSASAAGPSATATDAQDGSSRVREAEVPNVAVTAGGATFAHGLIYLKTGDTVAAARLATPDSHYLLEIVPTEIVLLRVVFRSLIMWDSIEASLAWIDALVPAVIRKFAVRRAADGSRVDPAARPGGKARDGGDSDSDDGFATAGGPSLGAHGSGIEAPDYDSLRAAHTAILAAGAIAIGLRHAGTGDTRVRDVLLNLIPIIAGTAVDSMGCYCEQPEAGGTMGQVAC